MNSGPTRFWVSVIVALLCGSCDHAINARLLGTTPVEIRDVAPEDLQKDTFTISQSTIENAELSLVVSSGGGCRKHGYSLIMTPAAFMESFPVQANMYLRHDAQDDPCDAIVTETVVFDLSPIITRYKQMYGPSGQINLNLFNFEQTESTRLELQVR